MRKTLLLILCFLSLSTGKAEAAVTAANLTHGISGVAQSSYATASISPGASKLDIITIYNKLSTGASNVPTVTGASGTWTLIGTFTSADGQRRVTMLRDLSASPGSGALTIDFGGQTQDGNCAWSVDEFSGMDTSGTHGSGAIVQNGGNTTSGTLTGLTITLSAFGSANNVAYGGVRNSNANTVVAGSGFTELSNDVRAGDFSTETEWKVNSPSVSWTWASGSGTFVGMAVEIKAAVSVVSRFGILTFFGWF